MRTTIAAILTTLVSTSHGYNGTLSFKPTSSPDIFTFTILQITDIHLGDMHDWTGDGSRKPAQDPKTYEAIDAYLSFETPDLIMLTGDNLHANPIDDNATAYYDILGEFMESHGTPWGLIFGNHDDAADDDTFPDQVAKTDRRELMKTLMKYSEFGVTKQDSPDDVYGVSNYVLDVTLQDLSGLQVLLLDSGGGTIPEAIDATQLEWLSTVRRVDIPAVFFQHIPVIEYETFTDNEKCVGTSGEAVDTVDDGIDAGVANYLIKDGNVMFMSAGHDHANVFCCPIDKLSVCYGKHSGYGGYAQDLGRGVRMFEVTADVTKQTITFKSWIRMEDGTLEDEYVPGTEFSYAANADSATSPDTEDSGTSDANEGFTAFDLIEKYSASNFGNEHAKISAYEALTPVQEESSTQGYGGTLSFKPTSSPDIFTFTILQITDIHLGDRLDWTGNEWLGYNETDYGPEQDDKTYEAIDAYLSTETPDLIVLSGDNIHANHIVDNATAYYDRLGAFMESHATPWGFIFGNHDDSASDAFPDEPARATRRDLMETMGKYTKFGVTKQDSPDDVYGVSNYVLDVTLQESPGLQVLLLDTGGGTIPEELDATQLDWLSTVRHVGTPGVAFQHIPAKEFEAFSDNGKCVGESNEGVYPPGDGDAGIANYLIKDGNVMFMSTGHDHGNFFCCPLEQFSVCYGKHSGYGGYAQDLGRGVRMFEITADVKQNIFTYKSWIRMEDGTVEDEYVPGTQFHLTAHEESATSATTDLTKAKDDSEMDAQEDSAVSNTGNFVSLHSNEDDKISAYIALTSASSSNTIGVTEFVYAFSALYIVASLW
jgi:metallophosphoesterase superfamily enzyme